jgi:hypothetical protein
MCQNSSIRSEVLGSEIGRRGRSLAVRKLTREALFAKRTCGHLDIVSTKRLRRAPYFTVMYTGRLLALPICRVTSTTTTPSASSGTRTLIWTTPERSPGAEPA